MINGGESTFAGADPSAEGRAASAEGAETREVLAGEGARWLLERYGVPPDLVSASAKAAWREQESFAGSVLIWAYAAVWRRDDG